MKKAIDEIDLTPLFRTFAYDPFAVLNASQDAHLLEYAVFPKNAAIVLKSSPSIIYAKPGGGKTALRIYTENTQQDLSEITFTLTYTPDAEQKLEKSTDHEKELLAALAWDILVKLVVRPGLFMNMDTGLRSRIAAVVDENLPVDLTWVLDYMERMNNAAAVEWVTTMAGRAFPPRRPAVGQNLKPMIALFKQVNHEPCKQVTGSINEALALVKEAFQAREIDILVDGVDSSTESKLFPELAARWIFPLFNRAEEWQKEQIYLKSFLTTEMLAPLTGLLQENSITIPTATIYWDDFLLVDVIRHRISAATGNYISSLYAICALELREVEMNLVRRLSSENKLPRDLIRLTHETLRRALSRSRQGEVVKIVGEDIDYAYQQVYSKLPGRTGH
jgi:hypothetical protein